MSWVRIPSSASSPGARCADRARIPSRCCGAFFNQRFCAPEKGGARGISTSGASARASSLAAKRASPGQRSGRSVQESLTHDFPRGAEAILLSTHRAGVEAGGRLGGSCRSAVGDRRGTAVPASVRLRPLPLRREPADRAGALSHVLGLGLGARPDPVRTAGRGPGASVIETYGTPVAPNRELACPCGQRYLVTGSGAALRLWPRAGNAGYNRHGLRAGCSCIRCGTRLAVGPG
jgi:hypothetical protein